MTLAQLLSLVGALVSGGVLGQLFTLGAQRRRIIGDSAVAEANAAKTYHEMSMEIFREVRVEADKLQSRVQQLTSEVENLQRQVHIMNIQLEDKDREIERLKKKD